MKRVRKTVGRRFSRRIVEVAEHGGQVEPLDHDAHHLLTDQSVLRMKAWALQLLDKAGVPATELIQRFYSEMINEGEAIFEHVRCINGTEPDDQIHLAADIYRLCRYLEISDSHADESVRRWCGNKVTDWAYRLGRLSMLAKVYGIDSATRSEAAKVPRQRDPFREALVAALAKKRREGRTLLEALRDLESATHGMRVESVSDSMKWRVILDTAEGDEPRVYGMKALEGMWTEAGRLKSRQRRS